MSQYTLITDLPPWLLKMVDSAVVLLATITGHSVIISSVRPAGENDEQAAE